MTENRSWGAIGRFATNNIDVALQYVNSYSPFGRLNTGVGDDIVDFGSLAGRVVLRLVPMPLVPAWNGESLPALLLAVGEAIQLQM
jgi:hypothetical protein